MVTADQTNDVYSAEFAFQALIDSFKDGSGTAHIMGSTVTLDTDRKFADLDSIQRYVNRVLALGPVQDRWEQSIVPIGIVERKGNKKATYHHQDASIRIPTHRIAHRYGSGAVGWAMRETVVLHEVAHHLSHPDDGDDHHGALFVGNLLDLVEIVMSPEHAFALRGCMYEENVAIKSLAHPV